MLEANEGLENIFENAVKEAEKRRLEEYNKKQKATITNQTLLIIF